MLILLTWPNRCLPLVLLGQFHEQGIRSSRLIAKSSIKKFEVFDSCKRGRCDKVTGHRRQECAVYAEPERTQFSWMSEEYLAELAGCVTVLETQSQQSCSEIQQLVRSATPASPFHFVEVREQSCGEVLLFLPFGRGQPGLAGGSRRSVELVAGRHLARRPGLRDQQVAGDTDTETLIPHSAGRRSFQKRPSAFTAQDSWELKISVLVGYSPGYRILSVIGSWRLNWTPLQTATASQA